MRGSPPERVDGQGSHSWPKGRALWRSGEERAEQKTAAQAVREISQAAKVIAFWCAGRLDHRGKLTAEVPLFINPAETDPTPHLEFVGETVHPRAGSLHGKTTIDELGVISADDIAQVEPGHVAKPIESSYWHLAGAMYAYLFAEMTKIGIDVAGESQLVGFPTQFPSVSMLDWNDGKPNPRFWVLKLLHDNFGPGDKVVEVERPSAPTPDNPYVYSLAFATHDGKRKVLLVNKRNRTFDVTVTGASGGQIDYVDQTTAFQPPASAKLPSENLKLPGYSVAVVTLP